MRTDFDSSERDELLAVARAWVEGAVRDGGPAPELRADLAAERAFGVFTTLRRGGLLRSCLGHWPAVDGREEPFEELLRQSATHAASRDVRFPSIHPLELDLLEVELSILFPPRPLPSGAGPRLAGVEPGRHGLILEFRGRRGVLLPQVASDRGWDAATFLDQICEKTGVPADTWRDERAHLQVFEALHFSGPPRRREIRLGEARVGLASRLGQGLSLATGSGPALAEHAFEFWTGVAVDVPGGPEFWLRERGTLELLVTEGRERVQALGGPAAIRGLTLLTHGLPLKAVDGAERRQFLGTGTVWLRGPDGRSSLRFHSGREGDPVPGALRALGVSQGQWMRGEAEVMAFSGWPA